MSKAKIVFHHLIAGVSVLVRSDRTQPGKKKHPERARRSITQRPKTRISDYPELVSFLTKQRSWGKRIRIGDCGVMIQMIFRCFGEVDLVQCHILVRRGSWTNFGVDARSRSALGGSHRRDFYGSELTTAGSRLTRSTPAVPSNRPRSR
jgi:hypothetical protein